MIPSFSLWRYHAENRNLAFGEFKFGPVFMRLCYELGLEEMAADTLTDKVIITLKDMITFFKLVLKE